MVNITTNDHEPIELDNSFNDAICDVVNLFWKNYTTKIPPDDVSWIHNALESVLNDCKRAEESGKLIIHRANLSNLLQAISILPENEEYASLLEHITEKLK